MATLTATNQIHHHGHHQHHHHHDATDYDNNSVDGPLVPVSLRVPLSPLLGLDDARKIACALLDHRLPRIDGTADYPPPPPYSSSPSPASTTSDHSSPTTIHITTSVDGASSPLLPVVTPVSAPLPTVATAAIVINNESAPNTTMTVATTTTSTTTTVATTPLPISVPYKPSACARCHQGKIKCDGARPCGRCVRLNRSEQCIDRVIHRWAPGGRPLTNQRIGTITTATMHHEEKKHVPLSTLISPPMTAATLAVMAMPPAATTATRKRPISTTTIVDDDDDLCHFDHTVDSKQAMVIIGDEVEEVDAVPVALRRPHDYDGASPSSSSPSSSPYDDDDLRPRSRSPARKRYAKSPPPSDAAGSSQPTLVWSSSSSSSSLKVVSKPQYSLSVFDETKIIRIGLLKMLPWIRANIRSAFTAAHHDVYQWICHVLSRKAARSMPRVCPYCTSPTQLCSDCIAAIQMDKASSTAATATTATDTGGVSPAVVTDDTALIPITYTNSIQAADGTTITTVTHTKQTFGGVFASAFLSALWTPQQGHYVDVPSLATLPISACVMTFPPINQRPFDLAALLAHHRTIVSTITPSSVMGDMAATLAAASASLNGGAASSLSRDGLGVAACIPTSSGGRCGDPFDCPVTAVTISDDLERLLGYSRSDWMRRIGLSGWRADLALASPREASIVFKNAFLCILGLKQQWSVDVVHMVTKWNTIVRGSLWGYAVNRDGYRTFQIYIAPLPGRPVAMDPRDPLFANDI